MRSLSKSKLLAYRQCPKRLWLEIHRSDLIEWTDQAQATFLVGHEVSGIARTIYDPKGKGVVFDPAEEGYGKPSTLIARMPEKMRSNVNCSTTADATLKPWCVFGFISQIASF
jgi:hypothetical protein